MKLVVYFFLFAYATVSAQTDPVQLPILNQQIISFVDQKIGKKVGRGECWDLAQEALDKYNAEWNGNLLFGKEIDPKKEVVLPGDIVQFEKVKVKYFDGKYEISEEYQHHTAIVYSVDNKGNYQLAQQNTSDLGKKVGVAPFRMQDVQRGTVKFYRPVPKA